MAIRRHRGLEGDSLAALHEMVVGAAAPGEPIEAPELSTSHETDALAREVNRRATAHRLDPERPLLTIGRFDVHVRVGWGGFGAVFKARDPQLKRWVALKLCLTSSPRAIDELMEEAQVLAELRHPNIVTVYEFGHHDGAAFFAMEYIDGQNAQQFGKRDPRPTWQQIVIVYRGVARGLAAAHAKKLVHGDVKPSNVLLDQEDFSRIADFGLARRVIEDAEASEQEGLLCRAGTLHYMAPEILLGQRGDARSDQFSFFVSVCQTLSGGKLPYDGVTSKEVLDSIEHTDIPQFLLQFLDPSVPGELLSMIQRGLSIDPSERFPDMATVEAELERMLQAASSPPRDEPDVDDSESDEPDGPEQMHEPDRSDEPALALTLGEPPDEPEPESLGGPRPREASDSGPSWVINPNAPAVVRGGLSSVPASSVRRTASWVAFGVALGSALTGALALVVLGPASDATASVEVELPEPSELPEVSKPIELPYPHNLTSPCAMGDEEVSIADEELLKTCTQIRNGHLGSADTGWQNARNERLSGDRVALIEATLIVARTFVEHAIVIQRAGPEDAVTAARRGKHWAREAANWIDPHEGLNDPRVSPIMTRVKPLLPP